MVKEGYKCGSRPMAFQSLDDKEMSKTISSTSTSTTSWNRTHDIRSGTYERCWTGMWMVNLLIRRLTLASDLLKMKFWLPTWVARFSADEGPKHRTSQPLLALSGKCEYHGHLHIWFCLGRSHVGSNDSNYKIIKVSVDVHKGEHP